MTMLGSLGTLDEDDLSAPFSLMTMRLVDVSVSPFSSIEVTVLDLEPDFLLPNLRKVLF